LNVDPSLAEDFTMFDIGEESDLDHLRTVVASESAVAPATSAALPWLSLAATVVGAAAIS
jgi:hypothetical protein